jgi:hypothetical protein
MPDILITPPIRTPLTSSDGDTTTDTTPDSRSVTRTTRDWWLYWNRLGDQANSNAKLVTQGTHADRPAATDSPDGAIYVESDRSAIYQNQNGAWRYVAGTMWGTITPDQRPTDLGVNDGGFDFRGTDVAREFLWSQSQWIEVTAVEYGIHSGRPAESAIADGVLYIENDRGSVIYQLQASVWHYLAGTMWGTLSPDQRPTDLGANDAGFDFRGTDQQREFIWSGSAWVEVTPVTGALNLTHANVVTKVGSAGQIVEGGITDESAANSDHVHITAAGNVGINTPSPTGPLEALGIASGGRVNVTFLNNGAAGAGSRMRLRLGSWTGFNQSDLYPYVEAYNATADGSQVGLAFGIYQGAVVEVMRLGPFGVVAFPALPSTNPGAGTKQLWYDPADGNRVKYAP